MGRTISIALLFAIALGYFACKSVQPANRVATIEGGGETLSVSENLTLDGFEFSEAYRNGFAPRVRKVSTSEQLADLLAELDEKYDSYPNDVKFAAAQMIPLMKFRGLIYQIEPLFSKRGLDMKATPGSHNGLLAMVQGWVNGQAILAPYQSANVLVKYLTEPYVNAANQVVFQYKDTRMFQSTWMCQALRADLDKAAERMAALNLSTPVRMDLSLGYPEGALTGDERDRFMLAGEAERLATLSNMYVGLHNLKMACTYQADNVTYFTESIGRIMGIDGFFDRTNVDGFPALRRRDVATGKIGDYKKQIKEFGKRAPGGENEARQALAHLRRATYYANQSYKQAVKAGSTPGMWRVLDTKRLAAADRQVRLVIASWLDAFNIGHLQDGLSPAEFDTAAGGFDGNRVTEFKSLITGQTVNVRMQRFYLNPPKDLRSFLPTNSSYGAKWKKVPGHPDKTYRNYLYGRASSWNKSVYGEYFTTLSSGSAVASQVRTLGEAIGGFAVAGPMIATIL